MGVLKSSGSTWYLVSTFSQAYKNLETSTIPSLKSSYLEVLLMASWVMPIKLPAASAPNPIFCQLCGRYPTSVNICGRVRTNLTGRFNFLAAIQAAATCGQLLKPLPKPPPTFSAITLTFLSGKPKVLATVNWVLLGPCVLSYKVILSSASQCAIVANNSIALCTSTGIVYSASTKKLASLNFFSAPLL